MARTMRNRTTRELAIRNTTRLDDHVIECTRRYADLTKRQDEMHEENRRRMEAWQEEQRQARDESNRRFDDLARTIGEAEKEVIDDKAGRLKWLLGGAIAIIGALVTAAATMAWHIIVGK